MNWFRMKKLDIFRYFKELTELGKDTLLIGTL